MRSADDNLVPSDKDLEHLLRKARKSAAKKEAYKKTTKRGHPDQSCIEGT